MADRHQDRTRPAGETTGTEERPAQQLVGAVLTFGLDAEIAGLRREDAWKGGDHNAKTLVKDDDVRVILIAMKSGARLPEHHAPTRITIQTLVGRLRIVMSERSIDLTAGSLVTLEGGLAHDVEALEESAFLLTVAWHGAEPHPLGLSA